MFKHRPNRFFLPAALVAAALAAVAAALVAAALALRSRPRCAALYPAAFRGAAIQATSA